MSVSIRRVLDKVGKCKNEMETSYGQPAMKNGTKGVNENSFSKRQERRKLEIDILSQYRDNEFKYYLGIIDDFFPGEELVTISTKVGVETIYELMTNKKYYGFWQGDRVLMQYPMDYGCLHSGLLNGYKVLISWIPNGMSLNIERYMFCKETEKEKLTEYLESLLVKEKTSLSFDDIILSQKTKDRFYKSTVGFLTDKILSERFHKYRMKFKRSLLLGGPPGAGKTTLIAWLLSYAEEQNWRIYNWDDLGNKSFGSRDKSIKSVYIFEDIDTVMTKREANILAGKGLGFQAILNLLDGAETINNYIVIMTANHPEVLDPALLRDGRTDDKIIIPYPDIKLKEQYIERHIKPLIEDIGEKLDKIHTFAESSNEISFATLDNLRKKVFIYNSVDKAIADINESNEMLKDKESDIGFGKGA